MCLQDSCAIVNDANSVPRLCSENGEAVYASILSLRYFSPTAVNPLLFRGTLVVLIGWHQDKRPLVIGRVPMGLRVNSRDGDINLVPPYTLVLLVVQLANSELSR